MALIVQKYGGTSVGNPERIKNVARRVAEYRNRGDQVVVIAGSQKGKAGKILEILPAKSRARVEGVAMIKRHMKMSFGPEYEHGKSYA